MANTPVKVTASPYRLVYRITGDGTVAGPTIASSQLIADSAEGPLQDLLKASYANQAAMRVAFMESNPGRINVRYQTTPVQTTAEQNLAFADVDVDAVTATRPEVNVTMSDTTGQIILLEIEVIQPPR